MAIIYCLMVIRVSWVVLETWIEETATIQCMAGMPGLIILPIDGNLDAYMQRCKI